MCFYPRTGFTFPLVAFTAQGWDEQLKIRYFSQATRSEENAVNTATIQAGRTNGVAQTGARIFAILTYCQLFGLPGNT